VSILALSRQTRAILQVAYPRNYAANSNHILLNHKDRQNCLPCTWSQARNNKPKMADWRIFEIDSTQYPSNRLINFGEICQTPNNFSRKKTISGKNQTWRMAAILNSIGLNVVSTQPRKVSPRKLAWWRQCRSEPTRSWFSIFESPRWQTIGMSILGLDLGVGVGLECTGLRINNKANRHIIIMQYWIIVNVHWIPTSELPSKELSLPFSYRRPA